jgi:hypothetical protein
VTTSQVVRPSVWLQQLEALEAVLAVHRAGPGGEPAGQFVTAVGRHGDRVDLDD